MKNSNAMRAFVWFIAIPGCFLLANAIAFAIQAGTLLLTRQVVKLGTLREEWWSLSHLLHVYGAGFITSTINHRLCWYRTHKLVATDLWLKPKGLRGRILCAMSAQFLCLLLLEVMVYFLQFLGSAILSALQNCTKEVVGVKNVISPQYLCKNIDFVQILIESVCLMQFIELYRQHWRRSSHRPRVPQQNRVEKR